MSELQLIGDLIINPNFSEEEHNRVIVRVITSAYSTKSGFAFKKEFRYLKRLSIGFNWIDEDIKMVGEQDIISKITNLLEVEDGIYEISMCNIGHDWETGTIDVYDYVLTKYKKNNEG